MVVTKVDSVGKALFAKNKRYAVNSRHDNLLKFRVTMWQMIIICCVFSLLASLYNPVILIVYSGRHIQREKSDTDMFKVGGKKRIHE